MLDELELVELSLDPPACLVLDAPRVDLELSSEFRAARDRLAEITRGSRAPGARRRAPARGRRFLSATPLAG